jgi:hypothetical protein
LGTSILPSAAFYEEVGFSLGAGASRIGPVLDTADWYGSTQPDFTENRQFGFPLLDGVIHPPGNCNLILQYGVPTFPIAEPPVLSMSNYQTIGAPAATWTPFSFRVTARFARIQVVDTSGAANNGIYFVAFIRGA